MGRQTDEEAVMGEQSFGRSQRARQHASAGRPSAGARHVRRQGAAAPRGLADANAAQGGSRVSLARTSTTDEISMDARSTTSAAPTATARVADPPDAPARDDVDAPAGADTARDWIVARAVGARDWVRGLSAESWVWIGIVFLAALLRYWGLGDKPLHHDESMHAFFSLQLAVDPSSYEYDPLLHGPFQFHAEGFVLAVLIALANLFHVASASGNPWVNDATARLLPATTGVFLVAITYGLRRDLGRIGAPIAAFLLAISPAFVYFSRFLREDIYFACFTYAMVVCGFQFWRKRTLRWLLALVVSFVLAYATKEAIFLQVAIFGSFLVILAVWEIGHGISRALPAVFSERERAFFGHAAPLLLLGAIGSFAAEWGLHRLSQLSVDINAHTAQMDIQVQRLENTTVAVLLYASIALAFGVIFVLLWQIYHDANAETLGVAQVASDGAGPGSPRSASQAPTPSEGSTKRAASVVDPAAGSVLSSSGARARIGFVASLRERLDPRDQRFLRFLLGIPWVHWFVAFVVGWVVFAALYWVVPGPYHAAQTWAQGFQLGIGRGIWQGLYYWIQQQQVARGGQPWYYYLLLIPMYEQLAVVFGLIGLVVALLRPTRFRLFLVYWFVGGLGIYTWAGEKMPWLSIHILLPLELLASIPLAALVAELFVLIRRWPAGSSVELDLDGPGASMGPLTHLPGADAVRALVERAGRTVWLRPASVIFGLALGLILLIPTTYGMITLAHKDAANGPHEMMVYVQTTPDVQLVMDKLAAADAKLYGGRHQLRIAVGQGEEWPFYWYLRDYWLSPHPGQYATFDPPVTSTSMPQEDVLILTDGDAATFMALHPHQYTAHTYSLRSWWDEGYKPPPCVPAKANPCSSDSYNWGSGVGAPLWLSYGDAPPPHAHFDAGRAASRLWAWLWQRQALGATDGSYNFVVVVRNGVPIHF